MKGKNSNAQISMHGKILNDPAYVSLGIPDWQYTVYLLHAVRPEHPQGLPAMSNDAASSPTGYGQHFIYEA